MNADDFHNMVPGEPMREPYFHLMRISAPEVSVSLEVAHAIAGSGALLLVLRDEATGEQSRNFVTERLRARMVHEEMRSYPAYFPLLDEESLQRTTPQLLTELLQGVSLYLREDTVTQSSLLISRVPLDVLFRPDSESCLSPHDVY